MTAGPTIRTAAPGDAAALAALWAHAFTPPLAPDQWEADPERFAHTIVAEDASGLVGSIHGRIKHLREEAGGLAQVHAIGSVAVADRARGHGVARRLVSATLSAARRSGADWALLFTGTPGVYRSRGFETFAMARVLAGPWQAQGATGGADVRRGTVRPGASTLWRRVYEDSREGVALAPVRSEIDWIMAEVRLAGLRTFTVEREGSVLGYAVAEVRGGRGELVEFAVPSAAPDRIRTALLDAVAEDWRAAGVDRCEIAVPARLADLAIMQEFAPGAAPVPDTTGMTRAVGRAPRLTGVRHFGAADYF
ncbi:GNAT family N-acetyltransferase [Microbacterium sp. NPDC089698]|uniref:GNAT family N-acetyltransferase n=1 Tax=Microbacterium sp. NPDC089698 TaxID=3364200 RepID=UPI00382CEDAF